MIPKIIHYCWFGRNPKTPIVEKCIESWKKYCPEYEIIEWNEDNFDIFSIKYTTEAYSARKWAFVADYVRLYALYAMGGIYLDTDMELFRDLSLFENDRGVLGFEAKDYVALGLIGVEKGNSLIKNFKAEYEKISFLNDDGSYNMLTNVHRIKALLVEQGLVENGKKQTIGEFTIYPAKMIYPNTLGMVFGITPKQKVFIHHAEGSWRGTQNANSFIYRLRKWLVGVAREIVGTDKLESIRDRKKAK